MTTVSRIRRAVVACLAGSAVLGAPAAFAADHWPTKPITLVVPFASGGTTDILARTIGQKLGEALLQPVVVDNRPGAGGTLGAANVARAPADG
ncbi:Bug family tripartite tricarboxylate transporter substrate binding protein, partial [Cupriavidus basilensis]|uniref:Bug family tripartite tricarboxylate transporter substrate binding protein n=1 Tax=Cupriavidus basilensis TaxID=68895 RepID=UPI0023E7A1C6